MLAASPRYNDIMKSPHPRAHSRTETMADKAYTLNSAHARSYAPSPTRPFALDNDHMDTMYNIANDIS